MPIVYICALTQSPDISAPLGASVRGPSLPREPRLLRSQLDGTAGANVTMLEKCQVALRFLNQHAVDSVKREAGDQSGIHDIVKQTVLFRVPVVDARAAERSQQPFETKEHADWAKFGAARNDQDALHAQARMEFQGHFTTKEAANFSKAVESWKLSADGGHGGSAWALIRYSRYNRQ